MKTAAMGTLTIAWDQVAGITSAAPLTVVLKDKTEKATLGGGDGKIELKESQQTVAAADVQAIRGSGINGRVGSRQITLGAAEGAP